MKRCVSIIAVSFIWIAFGSFAQAQKTGSKSEGEQKLLRVLCFPEQSNPFVSVNLSRGSMKRVGSAEDFQGIDIEIMKGFAKSLGATLEVHTIVSPNWDLLIPTLLRDEADIIIGGFSITPDRQKLVDFSDPYYAPEMVVITQKGSAFAQPKDLANKKAAIIAGGSHLGFLKRLGIPGLQVKEIEFIRDVYMAVRDGEADFTILDSPGTANMLKEFTTLKIAFKVPSQDKLGYALPKGSNLRGALNRFLAELKATGQLQVLLKPLI